MRLLSLLLSFFVWISCTKDRIFEDPAPIPPDSTGNIVSGKIRINEFVARGSLLSSNLGINSDWIELHNPGPDDITLTEGNWFITDNLSDPEKAAFPSITIKAGEYLVVFCDDTLLYNGQLHLPFGLSSSGEAVGIFYKSPAQELWIDSVSFGPQNTGYFSNARIPDGIGNWNYPSTPSPGKRND
jgi:hypothetical protein